MSENMTIENAWVDDPLSRGELLQSKVCIQVNIWPDVTIPDKNFDGGWMVGKYGPFVKYWRKPNFGPANAGDFNMRFAQIFPPVVDIALFKGHTEEYHENYAINLRRARQLLRKHSPNWRLLLADRHAQEGQIVWFPSEKNSSCKFWIGTESEAGLEIEGHTCGMPMVGHARRGDIDIPFCTEHMKEYNQFHARGRTERTITSK